MKALPVENKIVLNGKNKQKKSNTNASEFSVLNELEWHHAAMK